MQEKTSGIQAVVTKGSSVYSLTSSSEIFGGRGYSFAGSSSVGVAILEETVNAFQISYNFFSRIFLFKIKKMQKSRKWFIF